MGSQRPLVELYEIADALAEVSADCGGPNDIVLAQRDFVFGRGILKSRDIGVGGSREEKQLIEIALARQLGFAFRQTSVLRQLARRERPQRNDLDFGFFGKGIESVLRCRQQLCDRDGCESAEANRLRGFQMEIIFGQVDAAAVFSDERAAVTEAAARFVDLQTGSRSDPNRWNAVVVEGGAEFVESRCGFAADGNDRIDGDEQDGLGLPQRMASAE